jgi:hypothetical protein
MMYTHAGLDPKPLPGVCGKVAEMYVGEPIIASVSKTTCPNIVSLGF